MAARSVLAPSNSNRLALAEASYTLLLYDELLEWSDRPLREFLNYPMQSEWQRKEYLHLTIIQNFDRGKVSRPVVLPPLLSANPPSLALQTLWRFSGGKKLASQKPSKIAHVHARTSVPDEAEPKLRGVVKTAPFVSHGPIFSIFSNGAIC